MVFGLRQLGSLRPRDIQFPLQTAESIVFLSENKLVASDNVHESHLKQIDCLLAPVAVVFECDLGDLCIDPFTVLFGDKVCELLRNKLRNIYVHFESQLSQNFVLETVCLVAPVESEKLLGLILAQSLPISWHPPRQTDALWFGGAALPLWNQFSFVTFG